MIHLFQNYSLLIKRISYILIPFVIFLSIGCKDECKKKDSYSITLTILNGTTNGAYYNLPVTLRNQTVDRQRHDVLDIKNTDSFGKVTLNYNASSCDELRLSVYSDAYYSELLPSRVSFSDTVYASTYGKLQIYLNSSIPLNQDTLFLYYSYSNGNVQDSRLDTLVNFTNGLYMTLIYKMGHNARFFWGRGINNLNSKINSGAYKEVKISGDPVIDKFTINY